MATVLQMIASLDAGSMTKTVEAMQVQADRLGETLGSYTAKVDDKAAQASILRMTMRAERLQDKLRTDLSIDGVGKAALQLLGLEAQADRLNKKLGLDVRGGFRGGFASGFGGVLRMLGIGTQVGSAGGGTGILGLLGTGAGGVTAGGGTLGVAGGLLALVLPSVGALVDALTGQALGFAGAGAGALLAQKFPANRVVAARGIAGAGGPGGVGAGTRVTGAAGLGPFAAGLADITKMLRDVAQAIGPSMGLMFAQFGKTMAALGPQLAQFFSATLPFFRQFLGLATVAAKTILPALTQMLQQMVQSGALKIMTQGFVFLIQGIADFIKHIGGPAMKAGAEVFRAIALGIKGILIGLGATFNWLGDFALKEYAVLRKGWDDFRHFMAVQFDLWRHAWAVLWDQVFSVAKNAWNHVIGAASSAWEILVKGIKGAIGTILHVWGGLPDQLIHALYGLGHSLYAFARASFFDFLNGAKSVAGSIISWATNFIKSLPHTFMSALGMSPPHPGSAFYDLGANMMHHMEAGMRARVQKIGVGAIIGATGGRLTGSPAAAAAYARSILGAYGWGNQWAALNAVAMRESGWRMNAQNPTSPAYGIAQFIGGPSEYYQYGGNPNTIAGQVIAFFNYIRQTYGNPSGAWQHELNFGWYDRGGWLPPGLTLALNQTGRPERVGGGGGDTYNITVQVGPGTHPVAAAQAIAKILNDGAKSGVKLRTSILGPG